MSDRFLLDEKDFVKVKRRKYVDILKKPKRKLRGGQKVPMDIDKINASFEATQKKE